VADPNLRNAAVLAWLLAGLALAWIVYELRRLRRGRRLQDPGPTPGTSDDGRVDLEGTVEPVDETLVAPLSGEECVAVDYRVRNKDRGDSGTTLVDDLEMTSFELSTDGSTVLVDIDADVAVKNAVLLEDNRCVVDMQNNQLDDAAETNSVPRRVRETVERESDRSVTDSILGMMTYTFDEARLSSGDTAFVSGALVDPSAVDGSAPREVDWVLRPPDRPDGIVERLRSTLDPTPPLLVTNESASAFGRRRVERGRRYATAAGASCLLLVGLGVAMLVWGG
jgi:hypothetical protein